MYPRPPENAGNQSFPSPFFPGIAVTYTCASGFALLIEQTFMCNASDGNFTPLMPPNCTLGNLSNNSNAAIKNIIYFNVLE